MSSSTLETKRNNNEDALVRRQTRIESEDAKLRSSKNNRKVVILDYLRRGRLKDGIEILPDIIDLTPQLLEDRGVDLEPADFDIVAYRNNVLAEYATFEEQITQEDKAIRSILDVYGVKPKENGRFFVDREWLAQIAEALAAFSKPKDAKNPQSDSEFEIAQRKKREAKIASILNGDISTFVDRYKPAEVSLPDRDLSNPIKRFLFQRRPAQGYQRFPKFSEYTGPTVEQPPRFVDKEPKPNLDFVPRDVVPTFKGGIILDGNFGFDESRNPLRPADKLIIDHHDKFNTSTRDTATTMTFAFLEDRKQLEQLDDPQYQDENGVVKVVTNNIDADSILSTWTLYNRQYLLDLRKQEPKRYASLKNILCKITEAGDFLLGSNIMEHGATARDYEYIIRNYLDACRQQIKDERAVTLTSKLGDLERQQAELRTELKQVEEDIEERMKDAEVAAKVKEIETVKAGVTVDGAPMDRSIQGAELKKLNEELRSLLGEVSSKKKALNARLQVFEKEVAGTRKNLEKVQVQSLTHTENALLLSHMHDTILDIVEHPFKYHKFIQQGREAEETTINRIDTAYRSGEIEITQDTRDSDILTVRPLTGDAFPDIESQDGEYFYYRSREDFNRELIVKFVGQFFMMAINTQNMKGLQKYNFDDLIDFFRTKEAVAMKALIVAKQEEIASLEGQNNDKRKAELRRELETLKADEIKNDKGQMWRSRTQMIFAFKSYIPENEIMGEIYAWKEAQSRPDRVKGLTKEIARLFPGKNMEPVRKRVVESLSIPQLGPHHNEGTFMDTHLQLMVQGVQDIELGRFPEGVPQEVQIMLQETIAGNQESLKKYIFLHDIAKADTLRLTYNDGKIQEITLNQWLEMLPADARENPVLLQNFLKEQGMRSISYYHSETESKAHGEEGKKYLDQFGEGLDVPPHLLTAISLHEIAFQFTKINVDMYNKFFSDLSPEEISWVMTASYLDTVASKGSDGKSDLSNFRAMAGSVHNGQILKQVEEMLSERQQELDPKKVTAGMRKLTTSEIAFTESASEIASRLIEASARDKYDITRLGVVLDALVFAGNITTEQKNELINAVGEDGLLNEESIRGVRSQLGSANAMVNEAFKSSRIIAKT